MKKKEAIYPVRNRARAHAPKGPLGRAISNGVYLDYAATTPVDPRVKKVMDGIPFGNPNSLHYFGREALRALDESRATIAKSIGADFNEIIFTGSATEANNLALRGIVHNLQRTTYNTQHNKKDFRPKIIISAVEHESVFETARDLSAKDGVEMVIIPVDKNGIVDVKKIEKELDERTILVSVMYVNNEMGTVQDISKIGKIISDFRKQIANSKSRHLPFANGYWPLFHTDAVQAFQFFDCDVKKLGVDFMTLSAHKIYGPKGVGALYVRRQIANSKEQKEDFPFAISNLPLSPIVTGGGQEYGMRSGTQNISGIVGFAKAVALADKNRIKESKRISKLKDELWTSIKKIYPKAEINPVRNYRGDKNIPQKLYTADDPCYKEQSVISNGINGVEKESETSPHILNVWFPGIPNDLLFVLLDKDGIAVSTGSACQARAPEPSRVIKEIYGEKRARESIRFSFGRETRAEDIARAVKVLRNIFSSQSFRV